MSESKIVSSKAQQNGFVTAIQLQQLDKFMAETNKSLNLILKNAVPSAVLQNTMQNLHETMNRYRESFEPFIQTINLQSKLIAKSLEPTFKLVEIYNAQLSALESITKISYPLFVLSDSIVKRRELIHQKLDNELKVLGEKYHKMWNGSWIALDSNNPDNIRQSAISMRELFRSLIHEYSNEDLIRQRYHLKKGDTITRHHRLEFILTSKGITKEKIEQLNNTISFALGVDKEIQKITHEGGEEEKFRNLLYLYEGFIWLLIKLDNESTN